MKTIQSLRVLLTVAAVVTLGLGISSCTDKIDNSATPGDNPQEQQAEEVQPTKAQKFWAVASHLVDVDDYTEDYEDKTFEPVYGVSQGDAGTRYVYTNTAAAAAAHFADLVERDDIDENTQSYIFDDPDVGRLVYNKGTGRLLATVTVDIKQIPTLSKIVYVPGAYANGSFNHKAYYRFGDVVSRQNINYEGQQFTEYWICVRPSFGPEGKGDSHWVSLSELPKKNTFHHHGSNGRDYYLPTGLGSNKIHMQNLAEMLYAIYFPEDWESYATSGFPGLEVFHDFSVSKLNLHNRYFWKNVQQAWRTNNILKKVLNYNRDENAFREMLKGGLSLLHDGLSWYTSVSWNCTLYETTYKLRDTFEPVNLANLHKSAYRRVTQNVKELDVDCRKMGLAYLARYQSFFGDDKPRWVIRHATGKELASDGKYDVKKPIAGVEQVYRYYDDVLKLYLLGDYPEQTKDLVENARSEAGTYMFGDVVADEHGNRWICINGSAASPDNPTCTDSTATFISFDFNGVDISGNTVAGLPTADEVPELALRITNLIPYLKMFRSQLDNYNISFSVMDSELGVFGRHILKYAGVDLRNLFTPVDTTLTFTSNGTTYNSRSTAQIINFAYNDGSADKQAVCRVIYDNTQGGSRRKECVGVSGVKYCYWAYRAFLHYQVYDPSRMIPASADAVGLGIKDWCRRWPLTDDKMYLQDVASQEMVDRYGRQDKWATLPLVLWNDLHGNAGLRRPYRTQAATSAKPGDYIGHYGEYDEPKTNMYNEPVCFIRVMKVKDTGNQQANLVSTDGRRLTIVHLQNDLEPYNAYFQSMWAPTYVQCTSNFLTIDHQYQDLPPLAGMEDFVDEEPPAYIE